MFLLIVLIFIFPGLIFGDQEPDWASAEMFFHQVRTVIAFLCFRIETLEPVINLDILRLADLLELHVEASVTVLALAFSLEFRQFSRIDQVPCFYHFPFSCYRYSAAAAASGLRSLFRKVIWP